MEKTLSTTTGNMGIASTLAAEFSLLSLVLLQSKIFLVQIFVSHNTGQKKYASEKDVPDSPEGNISSTYTHANITLKQFHRKEANSFLSV